VFIEAGVTMGFQDFVSESEAASLSGVSVSTLRRFSEVGYLKVERDADGVPLFSKSELGAVFGALSPAPLASAMNMPSFGTATSARASGASKAAAPEAVSPSPTLDPQTEIGKSGAVASLFELLGKDKRPLEQPSFSQQVEKIVAPEPLSQKSSSDGAAVTTGTGDTTAALASSTTNSSLISSAPEQKTSGSSIEMASPETPPNKQETPPLENAATAQITQLTALLDDMRSENRKLRTVVDLQEKILTIRENEIRDLKEQRDWLKSRLERLEEKADRDQLLLLSETQTIRRLISLQEPKKSTFRLALDWLGVTPQSQGNASEEGSSTIVMGGANTQRPQNSTQSFTDSSRGNDSRKSQDARNKNRSSREAA
jgi:hypothetical protein